MTRLYDPTVAPSRGAVLAPRLDDLNNKVIGLLDISKAKGNYFLDRLAERLFEQFRPQAILRRMKPTYARPAPEELRKELEQQCDLIIEALAD